MAFVIPAAMAAVSALGTSVAASATAAAGAGIGAAAASSPAWLSAAGIGAGLIGGGVSAYGAYQQGQAQAGAARYNADLEKQNATVSRENAAIAGQAGSEQGYQVGAKTRATVGNIKANQAASGVDVNSGSALDVRSSAAELGELDALTVRSNATREAYGYAQQARSHDAQSNLDLFEADNAETAGAIGAASTFLGSAGSAATNFAKYQLAGGFSG